MRWFVEISSLGKKGGKPSTLCVEATQWQPALQRARELRGEDGPLSNFSIELLDDGYRAIDPSSRLRYVVKRAPDDAALSSQGTDGRRSNGGPEAGSKRTSKTDNGKHTDKAPKSARTGSSGKGAEPGPPPRVESVAARPLISIPHDVVPPPPVATPNPPSAVSVAPPPPASVKPAVPFQVIAQRAVEPNEKSPLHYREQVYAVATGTTDTDAERLVRECFAALKASLAGETSGKFVNLAVFDHVFTDKPRAKPLVTLTWKDWKAEEPELRFPYREPPGTPTAPPPSAVPPNSTPPKAEAKPVEAPKPVEAKSEPPKEEPKPEPVPEGRIEAQPVIAVEAQPEEANPVAPEPPPAEAKSAPPEIASPAEPPPAVAKDEPAAPAPVPASKGKRATGDDLLAELFEAFSDLQFLADSLLGAEFVLTLVLEKIPSELGLLSFFDINKREFVVVRQMGGEKSALCTRQPEKAPLALAAMRRKRAVVVPPDQLGEAMDDRYRTTGIELKSLVCTPIALGGRYLGLIEVANPLDGSKYTDADGNALSYIGEQFGEFVAERGVVTDSEVVLEFAKSLAARASTAKKR